MGKTGDEKHGLDGLGRKLTRSVDAPHISLHNVSPNSLGGPVGPIPVRLTTYYHDNYIYESNGTRILIPGGYIMKQGSIYSYHYYVNDYQGNVRAVIDENGNLEEANDYYPYGMLMTDDSGNIANVQPYKFSAKEYETCYGLNIYDFGARRLNPASLIFTTPDPMCEKYYSISPCIYCAGNPVMFSDPTGKEVRISGDCTIGYIFQLNSYYGSELNLTLNQCKLNYMIINSNDALSPEAQRLIEMIDNHNITLDIFATSNINDRDLNILVGGAFMGSIIYNENGEVTVLAMQDVQPIVLSQMDEAGGKKGQHAAHELTEAYEGALYALENKTNVLPGTENYNTVYNMVHNKAVPQTATLKIFQYDKNDVRIFSGTPYKVRLCVERYDSKGKYYQQVLEYRMDE